MAAKSNSRTVTGTSAVSAAPALDDLVTFVVVKPFCGLDKGTKRTVRLSPEIKATEAKGLIKFV